MVNRQLSISCPYRKKNNRSKSKLRPVSFLIEILGRSALAAKLQGVVLCLETLLRLYGSPIVYDLVEDFAIRGK